jgi:thiosulfate/3-mercaptopyruvate sulfurtransferase
MAARSFSSYLVTPAELAAALKSNPPAHNKISTLPRTVPLCASWFLPNDPKKRSGIETFRKQRIPNARFFDLDAVCDKRSLYPHMLPSAENFACAMAELGIHRDDTVVVYDDAETGIFSAPRVGWTLRIFGHESVHILNNFKLWVEQGLPIESGEFYDVNTCPYPIPKLDEAAVAEFEEVLEIAKDYNKEGSENIQILDARPKGRWTGADPEPRPGLSSGHIPGSFSVPVGELLDPNTKAFLPADQLRKVFESKGLDPEKRIVTSCGTGVTAAVIDAALREAGFGEATNKKLYDGSWT